MPNTITATTGIARPPGRKLVTHELNGMPVLPAGFHWNLDVPYDRHSPMVLSFQRGRVSRGGYSWLSAPIASTSIPNRWHWLVRLRARRMYHRNFNDAGELIDRTRKVKESFKTRYDPIAVHRSENAEATHV